jgi:Type II secretion system (T2SS), protein M subtype b
MSFLATAFSKIAALLLLLACLAAIGVVAHQPYQRLMDLRAEAETSVQRLEIMQRAASQQLDPATEGRVKGGLQAYYLPQAARGTLVANLQEQLRTYAASSSVNILQIAETQENAPNVGANLRDAIQLRVMVSGSPAGILHFFQMMEAAKPWIRVDNLVLHRALVASVDAQTEPPLEAEFDAAVYVASGAQIP